MMMTTLHYRSRTDYLATPFCSDTDVRLIGEAVRQRAPGRHPPSHATRCIAALYFLKEHPQLSAEEILGAHPDMTHATLNHVVVKTVDDFLSVVDAGMALHEVANFLLRSPFGKLDYVLKFYTPERLFGPEARQTLVEPDIRPLR